MEEYELLSIKQVAKILGMGYGAVYGFIKDGTLPARKLGGNGKSKRHWRVLKSDLDTFVGVKVRELDNVR